MLNEVLLALELIVTPEELCAIHRNLIDERNRLPWWRFVRWYRVQKTIMVVRLMEMWWDRGVLHEQKRHHGYIEGNNARNT